MMMKSKTTVNYRRWAVLYNILTVVNNQITNSALDVTYPRSRVSWISNLISTAVWTCEGEWYGERRGLLIHIGRDSLRRVWRLGVNIPRPYHLSLYRQVMIRVTNVDLLP